MTNTEKTVLFSHLAQSITTLHTSRSSGNFSIAQHSAVIHGKKQCISESYSNGAESETVKSPDPILPTPQLQMNYNQKY